MKTNADIIALQRVIRDLQRERRQWLNVDIHAGIDLCVGILRAHIKRLRARAAKGEGT